MSTLESQGAVTCEKPEGVAGCDVEKWKWRRVAASRAWGTLLGELLAEAGIHA